MNIFEWLFNSGLGKVVYATGVGLTGIASELISASPVLGVFVILFGAAGWIVYQVISRFLQSSETKDLSFQAAMDKQRAAIEDHTRDFRKQNEQQTHEFRNQMDKQTDIFISAIRDINKECHAHSEKRENAMQSRVAKTEVLLEKVADALRERR